MTDIPGNWRLVGLSNVLQDKEFIIDRDEMHLGRTDENELVVPGNNVSRQHSLLFFQNDTLWIRDLRSKNGTFVNNQAISEIDLHPGDIVRVAEFSFRVLGDEEPAPEEPPLADAETPPPPAAQKPLNRRALLYGVVIVVIGLMVGVEYLPELFSPSKAKPGKATPTATPFPVSKLEPIEATDEEVLSWQVKASAAINFNDMAAAVPLLRKIVAARPNLVRARKQLTRCETRLHSLVADYYANGSREFEKLYYDRAIREWRKALALSQGFDPAIYKKAEQRIREAEAELAK